MLPVTVHLPVAEKLAVKPELAVALTVKSGSPNVLSAIAPNVIVWFALATLNDCGYCPCSRDGDLSPANGRRS